MRLLILEPCEAAQHDLDALSEAWAACGDQVSSHRLTGPVEYSELLDVVLEAQPEVVLVAGPADDQVVAQVADVAWKFDSACRVAVAADAARIPGVVPVGGNADGMRTALRGEAAAEAAAPGTSAQAGWAARAAGPAEWVAAALIASMGWAEVTLDVPRARTLAQVRATVDNDERNGLVLSDDDGYQHWVAVGRRAPDLLRMLEDGSLGRYVTRAADSPDVWLGALEVIAARGAPVWRRELGDVLSATPGSDFRPGLSVLLPVDDSESLVEVQSGSHRLRAVAPPSGEPVAQTTVVLRPGAVLLVTGGCRHRLVAGRFLHLLFIRGWMKPQVLLAQALGDQATHLGEQGRRWCGVDVGLPTSVAEFLAVEEASMSGGLSQRKGSGI